MKQTKVSNKEKKTQQILQKQKYTETLLSHKIRQTTTKRQKKKKEKILPMIKKVIKSYVDVLPKIRKIFQKHKIFKHFSIQFYILIDFLLTFFLPLPFSRDFGRKIFQKCTFSYPFHLRE